MDGEDGELGGVVERADGVYGAYDSWASGKVEKAFGKSGQASRKVEDGFGLLEGAVGDPSVCRCLEEAQRR